MQGDGPDVWQQQVDQIIHDYIHGTNRRGHDLLDTLIRSLFGVLGQLASGLIVAGILILLVKIIVETFFIKETVQWTEEPLVWILVSACGVAWWNWVERHSAAEQLADAERALSEVRQALGKAEDNGDVPAAQPNPIIPPAPQSRRRRLRWPR